MQIKLAQICEKLISKCKTGVYFKMFVTFTCTMVYNLLDCYNVSLSDAGGQQQGQANNYIIYRDITRTITK